MGSKDSVSQYQQPKEIHLVGIGLGHAITPPAHNFVAASIDIPWRIVATECQTIADCVRIFHSANQAGGIVTMPWKGEIIKHLDHIDEHVKILKACNSVYFDEEGKLCGSNTDWVGIEGALRAAGFQGESGDGHKTAATIGAGGAARAAVYALSNQFGIETIYVLNRDDGEVRQMIDDCKELNSRLLHVKSLKQIAKMGMPSVIVGSVPDLEAVTPEERNVREIYKHLLCQEKGTMVDFCYHPMQTRNIQLAEDHGWQTVRGVEVVGNQVEALWRLWIDQSRLEGLDRDALWKLIREAAMLDSKGRQDLNAEIVRSHFGD